MSDCSDWLHCDQCGMGYAPSFRHACGAAGEELRAEYLRKQAARVGLSYADLVAQVKALATYCEVAGPLPVYVLLDPEQYPLPVPTPLLSVRFNEEGVLLIVGELLS